MIRRTFSTDETREKYLPTKMLLDIARIQKGSCCSVQPKSEVLAAHLPLGGKSVRRKRSPANLFYDHRKLFREAHRPIHLFQLEGKQTWRRKHAEWTRHHGHHDPNAEALDKMLRIVVGITPSGWLQTEMRLQ